MSLRIDPEEYSILTQAVFTRDGWRCRNCGYRQTLNAHHLQYRSAQGLDTMENLVALCLNCHEAEHRGDLVILGDDANYELKFKRINRWTPK